jgi:glutamine synthetase
VAGKNQTARLICDVKGDSRNDSFARDPRRIADKAEKYVRKLGYEYSYWGPEVEFFVFDKLEINTMTPYHGQSYKITSRESPWSAEGASG